MESRTFRGLLSDSAVTDNIVEHRGRFARFGSEYVAASVEAHGRRLVVADDSEIDDVLVRDVTEVFTSLCARLHGNRAVTRRATKTVAAAQESADAA